MTPEFCVVPVAHRTCMGVFHVSVEESHRIRRLLEEDVVQWVTFHDIHGSEVFVRAADIGPIHHSTPVTRERDRVHDRALEDEVPVDWKRSE